MRLPIESWKRTWARLGFRRVRAQRKKRQRGLEPRFEGLEDRQLLAADLTVTGFQSNGQDLEIAYEVAGEDAAAFDLGIYRSADGSTLDAQLFSERIDAAGDLSVGSHTATLTADFTFQLQIFRRRGGVCLLFSGTKLACARLRQISR